MKKTLIFSLLLLTAGQLYAQKSLPFKGYLYNAEYEVYWRINFYDNDISVPGAEIYGQMPGYFGDKHDGRKWLIAEAKVNGNTANLEIVNDYGSEDLTATLTCENDSTFTLRQLKGSTLKIARHRKWVKMPNPMTFKRQR